MLRTLTRIVIAPFFLAAVILGFLGVLFVVASISIGGWFEAILLRIGYRHKPILLPAVVGVVLFVGLGLAGMGTLGNSLIGWPGVILGPTLAIAVIAVADRW
jgi:hypothetical protein